MSKFIKDIIYLLLWSIPLIVSNYYIFNYESNIYTNYMILIFSYVILFFCVLRLTYKLEDLINIKYRLIFINDYTIKVEYLTLGIFFIPKWKRTDYELYFDELDLRTYRRDIYYSKEDDARYHVYTHKCKFNYNRNKYFERDNKPLIKIIK